MTSPSRADSWTRQQVDRLAGQYFPGKTEALERLVRGLAANHAAAWQSGGATGFRPTPSMYALALGWELDRLGPTCTFCKGQVEVPSEPVPKGPSGPGLSLGLRIGPGHGGLNIPQNLVLGHADCLPRH